MSDNYSELQNPETWDIEQAVVLPATQKPRAVVSVAFSRQDFILVNEAAHQINEKTSQFIRDAALEKASVLAKVTEFQFNGVSSNIAEEFSGAMFAGTVTHIQAEGGVREEFSFSG